MPSSSSDRALAAVVAGAVADAASQPLHWNYDLKKLDAKIAHTAAAPEFLHPSGNPFYTLEAGSNTCYGDQAYVLLRSLVANKGFDAAALSRETYSFFIDPQSHYGEYPGPPVKAADMPIQRGWRHASVKGFLDNVGGSSDSSPKAYPDCGSNDSQIDCACKIAPLVALYAGHPDLLPHARAAIRCLQNTDVAEAYGMAHARVLEKIILGPDTEGTTQTTPRGAVIAVIGELTNPARLSPNAMDEEVADAMAEALEGEGLSHRQFSAAQNAYHVLVQQAVGEPQDSSAVAAAVRMTMTAGGCNSSRAAIVGASLAAHVGSYEAAVPEGWLQKYVRGQEVVDLGKQLMVLRGELMQKAVAGPVPGPKL